MDHQKSKKHSSKTAWLLRTATVCGLLCFAGFIIYGWKKGFFSSQEAMQSFLKPFGIWAPVLFILIQVIQVVIPILPGGISTVAGVVLFGALPGFFYNYIGICIGSLFAFLLARRYGRTLVLSIAGERNYEKYSRWLEGGKKFDRFFAAAIFFPMAPDDLLCYLAGLTKMSVQKFTAIILMAKPASIALYSMGLLMVTKTAASLM